MSDHRFHINIAYFHKIASWLGAESLEAVNFDPENYGYFAETPEEAWILLCGAQDHQDRLLNYLGCQDSGLL